MKSGRKDAKAFDINKEGFSNERGNTRVYDNG